MSNSRVKYYIKDEYKKMDTEEIWSKIIDYLSKNKHFSSVTGINYDVQIYADHIFFQGGKDEDCSRATKGEKITHKEFIEAFDSIRQYEFFNTNLLKKLKIVTVPFSYKRAPFVGLLNSVGVIYRLCNSI